MEFGAAAEHWVAALVLSLFVLIGNPVIFIWIIGGWGTASGPAF
jgi:hypothetical protein